MRSVVAIEIVFEFGSPSSVEVYQATDIARVHEIEQTADIRFHPIAGIAEPTAKVSVKVDRRHGGASWAMLG